MPATRVHQRSDSSSWILIGVPSPPKGSAAPKPIHAAGESCGVGLHGVTAMATGYIPTLIAVPGELVAVLIGVTVPALTVDPAVFPT